MCSLKLPNHFVLPIANPFLSCPVAFYINRSSNKRSLLNKRTINYFFRIKNQSALHRVAFENRSLWQQLAMCGSTIRYRSVLFFSEFSVYLIKMKAHICINELACHKVYFVGLLFREFSLKCEEQKYSN